jgi:uncharacterized repeat protein (TIGR01451 family)
MKTNINTIKTGLLALIALALFPCVASAQEARTLEGHIPAAISRLNLKSTGQLPSDTSLDLVITLPPRNESALDTMLQQVYDPSSTNYHRYLTPQEFTSQFGPNDQDYQAVVNFAKNNGLAIVNTYSNKLLVDVRGKASAVEKAFRVNLKTYHHPTENRDFYAPDVEPTVDATLSILHVSGLNNYLIPHPGYVRKNTANNSIKSGTKQGLGSGPFGEYMGNDFRAAYVPGVSLDGTGQSLALFELDGYFTADILSYESQAGLPNVPLVNVAVDGGVPNPTGFGDPEVSLDIEMVVSMATNLTQLLVYEAPNGEQNSPVDLLSRIATDDLAKQISSSWLIGDDPAFDVFYKEMALQGQSFFQASGDNGAYYSNNEGVQEWADDTNITLVGGTTLSTTGPGGAWSSETVWNWLSTGEGDAGSGGGTNFNGILIPSWQQGISMTANGGSSVLRNVPDVALTADNLYVIFENGDSGDFGGTSAATPLWAAFTALVNEDALANSKPTVGFLNPALYAIGSSTSYTNCFHDITTGNNTNLVVGNRYFAVPGYDLCTGLGTPNGANLISALVAAPISNPITHLSPPLPPYGGTMSALNGDNPNGNWYLFVEDDQVLNAGGITNGWCLTLTTANPIGYVADNYLAMSASVTNLLPDGNVTFYIGVTNYGPSTSSNVMVSDTFPSGFTLVSSSTTTGNVTPNGSAVTWNVGNLANSAGAQLNLTLEAPSAGEQNVEDLAGVSAATPDQNSSDDSASVTLNVTSVTSPSLNGAMGSKGKFLLTVNGSTWPAIIQASTNLVNWVNISTNTPPFTFTDTVQAGFPDRFYRAVLQQ